MKALIMALLAVGSLSAADLTGTWNFTLQLSGGTGTPVVEIKQEGNHLRGTYKGRFGESKLEGTVDDRMVKFQTKINAQGNEIVAAFEGTIEGDGSMKGKVDFGGQADGTWTAKRGSSKAAGAVDVTGKWDVAVETSAGAGSPTFEFKQDGEKLTGTYNGQLGTAKLQGSVKDNKIEFKFKVDVGGNEGTVVYSGTIESDGTMKGKVDLAGMADGTWTGKRAK